MNDIRTLHMTGHQGRATLHFLPDGDSSRLVQSARLCCSMIASLARFGRGAGRSQGIQNAGGLAGQNLPGGGVIPLIVSLI